MAPLTPSARRPPRAAPHQRCPWYLLETPSPHGTRPTAQPRPMPVPSRCRRWSLPLLLPATSHPPPEDGAGWAGGSEDNAVSIGDSQGAGETRAWPSPRRALSSPTPAPDSAPPAPAALVGQALRCPLPLPADVPAPSCVLIPDPPGSLSHEPPGRSVSRRGKGSAGGTPSTALNHGQGTVGRMWHLRGCPQRVPGAAGRTLRSAPRVLMVTLPLPSTDATGSRGASPPCQLPCRRRLALPDGRTEGAMAG